MERLRGRFSEFQNTCSAEATRSSQLHLLGIELIAAPLLLALGTVLGPGILGDPLWLAAILAVSAALATGILFQRFVGLIEAGYGERALSQSG